MDSLSFSAALVRLMTERNLTQKDLALASGLSQASISRYTKDGAEPKVSHLIRLARVFGVSLDVLVGLQPLRRAKKAEAGLHEWRERAIAAEAKIQMLKGGMEDLTKMV